MIKKLLTLLFVLSATQQLFAYDNYLKGTWGVGGDWTVNEGVKFVNGKLTLRLAANTTYQFKLFDTNGDRHLTDTNATNENSPTMKRSDCTRWAITKHYDAAGANTSIITDVAGDYVFTLVWDNGGPHLSVTYPDSYERLDYIEYNGNDDISKTIHTGYIPNQNTIVETKFKATETGDWRAIFSARNKDAGNGISLYVNGNNNNKFGYFVGEMINDNFTDFSLNTDYTVVASLTSLKVNNNAPISISSPRWAETNRDLTLFSNPEKDHSFKGLIYYLRIKESSTLIHNFIPVRRVSDGAVGFLDTKTNIFATPNSGKTEGFVAGTPNRDWGEDTPWFAKYVFKNYDDKNTDGEDATAQKGVDDLADPDNDSKGNNWTTREFDDSGWRTMIMPCHNSITTNENGTKWEGYYNCYWFRRHFYLTADEVGTKSITIQNVHDDDYELYVNGHLIVKEDGWKTDINNPVKLTIPSRYLLPGDNVIAAEVQQNWGGARFDCTITSAALTYTEIGTAEELKDFAGAVNGGQTTKNAKLTADIDLAGTDVTIGNSTNKFKGVFYGQGHKIKNMTLTKVGDNVGLFGVTDGALIQDVELYQANVNVTSGKNTGVLVGTCEATTINRCAVVNSYLSGKDHTGSIAGCAKGNSLITNCYSNAKVRSNTQAGGLVGTSEGLTLEHCIFMGQDVLAEDNGATGLVSLLEGDGTTTIRNNLVATQRIFSSSDSWYQSKCFSLVNNSDDKPLVSEQNYCWDSTIFGKAGKTYKDNTNDNGTSVNKISPSNINHDFFSARGFDFKNDWKMVENLTYAGGTYPILKWMSQPATDVTINNNGEFNDLCHFMWENLNVKLNADITVTQPLGNDWVRFKGTFDGQRHSVTLDINTNADHQALFGVVKGGTTIQNLVTKGSVTNSGSKTAALVAEVKDNSAGKLTITNYGNEATVEGAGGEVAAVIANNYAYAVTLILENVYNTAAVSGTGDVSTICACQGNENSVFTNVYNSGYVTGAQKGQFVRAANGTYKNCYSTMIKDYDGNIYSSDNSAVVRITAVQVNSGELCYKLNGDQSNLVWHQSIRTDAYPVPFSEGHEIVYKAEARDDKNQPIGISVYNNQTAEFATITEEGASKEASGQWFVYDEPTSEYGVYQLTNAGNVEWFGQQIAGGNTALNGKLMNDIDFINVKNLHSPIGPNTDRKFNGEFNGQGFCVKNMIIDLSTIGVGFFGWVRGATSTNGVNTTIRNLVIGESCSITGTNKVGGIVGTYQKGGGTITIENVVNEASIESKGLDAGGIIGGEDGEQPTIILRNVVNKGDVTSTGYAGAIVCYLRCSNESMFENVVNLGTITNHRGGNMGRFPWGTRKNFVDLSDTNPEGTNDGTNFGFDSGLAKVDIASGKLAYYLNSTDDQATDAFYQTLGTDNYPVPFSEGHGNVYQTTRYEGGEMTMGYTNDNSTETLKASVNATTTALDLSKADLTQETLVAIVADAQTKNPNVIIYAKKDVEDSKNVVVNGTCENLVLTDGMTPLHVPVAFSATAASYTRPGNQDPWGTIILPYAPTNEDGIAYYELKEVHSNKLTFTKADNPEANKPYVFRNTSNADFATSGSGVIPVTPLGLDASYDGLTWTMTGVYEPTSVVNGTNYTTAKDGYTACHTAPNSWYIKTTETDGKKSSAFYSINGRFNLKPFRAYFVASEPAPAGISMLIDWEDDEATDIRVVEHEDGQIVDVIFDLSGRRHSQLQRGVNIVNGKKIVKK